MQGIIGCYIKDKCSFSYAKSIIDNMIPILEIDSALKIKRADFQNFSIALLSLKQTPYEFSPLYYSLKNKHVFVDGFVKNKNKISTTLDRNINNENLEIISDIIQQSGIYNIISFDSNNNELIIANDRYGARFLYYYNDSHCFIFGSNPKLIMASGLVKNKNLDYESVISILSHEYIMGDRSLAQAIKLFPHASYLILKSHDENLQRYWNFPALSLEKQSDNYKSLVEKGKILLKNAIETYALNNENIIIPLSGGLDSRTIACFLSDKVNCRALHIDYGFEKNIAKQIAQTLKLDLEVYPLIDWSPSRAIEPLILCSSQSIHQFWIYPFLKDKINKHNGTLVVDGYLMNEVIGGLSTLKSSDYSDINKIYPPLNHAFEFILGNKIRKDYRARHDYQLVKIINNCPSSEEYDKYLYFTILNYGRRFTLLFSVIHQYLCSVGLPMLDYQLMDFCLKLPFKFKINSLLYRDIINSSFPNITPIPWSRNRLPLDSSKNKNILCDIEKDINELKYYITRITRSKIETLPQHNKNRRFRKDKKFREFFLKIVFEDQTFDKGYISRSGLKRLIQLIDKGGNYFDIIEKVALIELVSKEMELY